MQEDLGTTEEGKLVDVLILGHDSRFLSMLLSYGQSGYPIEGRSKSKVDWGIAYRYISPSSMSACSGACVLIGHCHNSIQELRVIFQTTSLGKLQGIAYK